MLRTSPIAQQTEKLARGTQEAKKNQRKRKDPHEKKERRVRGKDA